MVKYTVIGGSASEELARKISKRLKAQFVKANLRTFPDGEGKITLSSEPKNGTIVIVQSTAPPVDSNLIQMLSLAHKAQEYADRIIAVIPYMGYARQDREFLPGEIITIKAIAKMLKSSKVSDVLTVDIHSKISLKQFKSYGRDVSATQDLVRHIKKLVLRNPLIVSPDMGGRHRAEQFANQYNAEFVVLQKKRNRTTGKVKILSENLDIVKDRDLILVDDMISTGGSIVKAAKFLKRQKCGRIIVACTHALLVNDAHKKIRNAGVSKIISTNTVPGTTSIVDISDTLAKAIQGT